MDPVPNEKKHQGGLVKGARFLFDLWWSTYQALVDTAGLEHAEELFNPYLKSHADAAIQILKDKFKLKTNDLHSLVIFLTYWMSLIGVILCNHQFFEQGYTIDIHYCPYANYSEALCFFNERFVKKIFQGANSDYELIYTKMLLKGDPFCQLMIKRKGHPIWGEVVKKPVEIPIPHWSDEEVEYWQNAGSSQQWIYATNALVDFAGKEKAVEILRPYMRALGMSIAVNLSKELGIKDADAIAMALIINECNKAARQKGEYLIHTPDRVEKEITECIFAYASQDICAEGLEARSKGICEAINSNYEFRLTKRMCKGDKVCRWVIKKK